METVPTPRTTKPCISLSIDLSYPRLGSHTVPAKLRVGVAVTPEYMATVYMVVAVYADTDGFIRLQALQDIHVIGQYGL